jgi:hypothetical protein
VSAGYAACSCDESLALRRELAEAKELLATAAAELDLRGEHLNELRALLRDVEYDGCDVSRAIGRRIRAALAPKETP